MNRSFSVRYTGIASNFLKIVIILYNLLLQIAIVVRLRIQLTKHEPQKQG